MPIALRSQTEGSRRPIECVARTLRFDSSLDRRLGWNLNCSRSWRETCEVLYRTKFWLTLGSSISSHKRCRTDAEHWAKQGSPGRPQEEHEDQRKQQKRFPKCRLRGALMVDIKQQCKERSHFNILASSTPKPTPSTKRPLAKTTPIATQRRTAERVYARFNSTINSRACNRPASISF
jgi:hypothetical protein